MVTLKQYDEAHKAGISHAVGKHSQWNICVSTLKSSFYASAAMPLVRLDVFCCCCCCCDPHLLWCFSGWTSSPTLLFSMQIFKNDSKSASVTQSAISNSLIILICFSSQERELESPALQYQLHTFNDWHSLCITQALHFTYKFHIQQTSLCDDVH